MPEFYDVVRVLEDARSGVIVQVSVLRGTHKHSFMVGRRRPDGTLTPHLQWRKTDDDKTYEIEHDLAEIVADLVDQAQESTLITCQRDYADYLEDVAKGKI